MPPAPETCEPSLALVLAHKGALLGLRPEISRQNASGTEVVGKIDGNKVGSEVVGEVAGDKVGAVPALLSGVGHFPSIVRTSERAPS